MITGTPTEAASARTSPAGAIAGSVTITPRAPAATAARTSSIHPAAPGRTTTAPTGESARAVLRGSSATPAR